MLLFDWFEAGRERLLFDQFDIDGERLLNRFDCFEESNVLAGDLLFASVCLSEAFFGLSFSLAPSGFLGKVEGAFLYLDWGSKANGSILLIVGR